MKGTIGRFLSLERRHEDALTADGLVTLARHLDRHHSEAAQHSRRVGRYSGAIAAELDLDGERVEAVRLAGLLHDIGKLAVSDHILKKPGPLTGSEWHEIREHPRIGAEMLQAAGLDDISGWVRSHHERPDGRGYPDGLFGDRIPLEARILSVADCYEAMTSQRTYSEALRPDEARAELRRHSGTQFDGIVVAAFFSCRVTGRFGRRRGSRRPRGTAARVKWS
jgi:putative nucleotidyltransferase with HDIG domain